MRAEPPKPLWIACLVPVWVPAEVPVQFHVRDESNAADGSVRCAVARRRAQAGQGARAKTGAGMYNVGSMVGRGLAPRGI